MILCVESKMASKLCGWKNCSQSVRGQNIFCSKECEDAARMDNLKNPVKKSEKLRVCLSCDKSFMSTGIGNRLCPSCSSKNENVLVYRVAPLREDEN